MTHAPLLRESPHWMEVRPVIVATARQHSTVFWPQRSDVTVSPPERACVTVAATDGRGTTVRREVSSLMRNVAVVDLSVNKTNSTDQRGLVKETGSTNVSIEWMYFFDPKFGNSAGDDEKICFQTPSFQPCGQPRFLIHL